MAYDELLAQQVREHLSGQPALHERKMFGGLSFMVDGHMVVSVSIGDADLLVRVDPHEGNRLLNHPGISRGVMGNGKTMAAGWLAVQVSELDSTCNIEQLLDLALAHREASG